MNLFKTLRPLQWSKNLLVFVPLLAAHRWADAAAWGAAALAALAFCLAASAGYLLNDLYDAEADRLHPIKRLRPLAAGKLTPELVMVVWVVLVSAGFWCGFSISRTFPIFLAVYLCLSWAYSCILKLLAPLDLIALVGFYLIRLFAGHAACGVKTSPWLTMFCLFLFSSLVLFKRFTELNVNDPATNGRGYKSVDAAALHSLGTTCGLLAVLVVALYTQSPDVQILYHHAALLLLACPLLLYWQTRLWLMAGRHLLSDDPLTAIGTDKQTYILTAIGAAIVWGAL